MAEMFVLNPGGRRGSRKRSKVRKRRAKSRAHHNPSPKKSRRRRSSYRRNPSGIPGLGGIDFKSIGWGVVGAVGVELGAAQVMKFMPETMKTSTPAKLAVKAGLVVASTMLTKHFVGGSAARAIAVGGGIALGVEIVRDFVLPMIPGATGLMNDYAFPDGSVSDYQLADASSEVPRRWGANWSSD